MKGKLLCDAGVIEEGSAVELGSKVAVNSDRCADNVGGQSTTDAPVYAVTDTAGHAEEVDTRDILVTL